MAASASRGTRSDASVKGKLGRTGTAKRKALGRPAAKPAARAVTPHRSSGRRLTVEQQQEYRSRAQFDDRVTAFGWLVNTKDRDHGEDLLVDIYDDGRSTGLSFSAQLKSTDDERRFVRKRDTRTLAYRLDVADVKHWSVSAQLVVVVVWDVKKKAGTWMTVPEIIKQLRREVGWRKQETVTIRFPRSNSTDDASLHRLRVLAADHNYPIVKRGKTILMSSQLAFPNSPEGIQAAEAFRQAIDYGEPARIEGKFIKKWKMSAWWERLYGRVLPEEITIESSPTTIDVPARLEVDTLSGVHIVLVELRRVKGGRHGLTLTNEHQRRHVDIKLVARREGAGARVNLHIGVSHPVADIFQTKDATELLLAMHEGLRMRLVNRETGKVIVEAPVPKILAGRSPESLAEWKAFLEKLCFIQSRIYRWGIVRISDGRVSRREARFVEDFHKICKTGSIERTFRFSADFGLNQDTVPKMIDGVRRGDRVELGIDVADAGHMQILNVRVPLGPMHARHDVASFVDQIERGVASGASSVKVVVTNALIREGYPDWAPSATKETQPPPSDIAGSDAQAT